MNYKLLAVNSESSVNIGDFIQSVAAAQFLPSIDGFVQREKLKEYDREEAAIIMNGWYIHHVEQWPPSPKILPLFVAFHINIKAKNELLSLDSLAYLKKYEPIGCRDMATKRILEENGVRSYFSGCLTLTLGYRYKDSVKNGKYYFVDAYYGEKWNVKSTFSAFLYYLFHKKEIDIIALKHPDKRNFLNKRIHLSVFYRAYLEIFDKQILLNAEYISHTCSRFNNGCINEEKYYFDYAEGLVKKYAKAKLVVTSRIHSALPCLGLDTPVLYVYNKQQHEADNCRMGGLLDLFHVIYWNGKKLEFSKDFGEVITEKSQIVNKANWKPLSDKLILKCKRWVESLGIDAK